jgi:hypothetical protein
MSKRRVLELAVAVLGFTGCSRGLDSAPVDAGGEACPGTPGASTLGEVPQAHRAAATACAPTSDAPPPDGGLAACSTDADCVGDAGWTPFSYCLHGVCSEDQCLSDADCTNGVCSCATDHGFPAGAVRNNYCLPSNCHTDADCGSGYCSPSPGYCGTVSGFYCHGPADTCVDPIKDCGGCGSLYSFSCLYAPTVGAFVCGQSFCSG